MCVSPVQHPACREGQGSSLLCWTTSSSFLQVFPISLHRDVISPFLTLIYHSLCHICPQTFSAKLENFSLPSPVCLLEATRFKLMLTTYMSFLARLPLTSIKSDPVVSPSFLIRQKQGACPALLPGGSCCPWPLWLHREGVAPASLACSLPALKVGSYGGFTSCF